MTEPLEKSGGCQCGQIRYRLVSASKMLYACHCTDCQKQSASAFGMSLIMDLDGIEFTQGAERLKTWDTRGGDGEIKRCAFCPDCGTRLYHGSDDPSRSVSLKAGSLDDTSWLRPVAHIWLRSAQPWVEVDCARVRCFDGEPEDRDDLRQIWREQTA